MNTLKQVGSGIVHPPPVSAPDRPASTYKPWSLTTRKRVLCSRRCRVKGITYRDKELASLKHMAALCRKAAKEG